jgi:hypothetical protein
MAVQLTPADASHVPGLDERTEPRLSLRLRAVLKCDKTPAQQVIATDITRTGCRSMIQRRVSVGTFVTLEIPDFVEVFGWVAWGNDYAVGIDFSHALPPAVLAHIVGLGPA